jgi:hypothetical protein
MPSDLTAAQPWESLPNAPTHHHKTGDQSTATHATLQLLLMLLLLLLLLLSAAAAAACPVPRRGALQGSLVYPRGTHQGNPAGRYRTTRSRFITMPLPTYAADPKGERWERQGGYPYSHPEDVIQSKKMPKSFSQSKWSVGGLLFPPKARGCLYPVSRATTRGAPLSPT